MSDLKELFDMVTNKTEPDLDSWKEQVTRQRRTLRNRKVGAFVIAAAIVAIAVVAIVNLREVGGPTVTSEPPPTSARRALSVVDVGTGTAIAFPDPGPDATDFDVTLDGSMVAYVDLDDNGDAQVFVMGADGSNPRPITSGERGVGDIYGPSWSGDGSMIAYQRNTSNKPQIFVVGVADGVSTRVTDEPEGGLDPGGWTPDGGSIVFSTFDPSIPHYSALSLDLATEQTKVIVADGSTPVLSPGGALIAFNSWLKPDVRLIIAESDGSERRTIARLDDDGHERWSPDGTQLAYLDDAGAEGFGTYVYDLATGETSFVTSGVIESWVDDSSILVSAAS